MPRSDRSETTEPITIYWRTFCPYCIRLGLGLRRAGIPFRTIPIKDPEAAAAVRAITGGDEVTPTVIVRGRSLVNPSVDEIRAVLTAP